MDISHKKEALYKMLEDSKRVVFFGGAGVSTESGIPDFRSKDGLYNLKYKYPPEEILSHEFFCDCPEEFYRFYYEKIACIKAEPNRVHRYFAELEKRGRLTAVVTQNIDGLHQAAGSKKVYELHGSIHRNTCHRCGKHYTLNEVISKAPLPRCECGAIIKPDVVLYGEPLDDSTVSGALNAISECDLLIVGGTSLAVYPAASFIDYRGGKLVIVNKDATPADSRADLAITGCNLGDVFF